VDWKPLAAFGAFAPLGVVDKINNFVVSEQKSMVIIYLADYAERKLASSSHHERKCTRNF